MVATGKKKQLSKQHLANLAAGRTEAATVNRYLTAMEQPKKRGRKVDASPARIAAQQKVVDEAVGTAKLTALQKLLDLQEAAKGAAPAQDLAEFEAGFVRVAASYGKRKGISVAAWRKMGVPADVLKKAKIT